MFGQKKKEPVDAVKELDDLEGVGGSTLGNAHRSSPPGSRMFMVAIVGIILIVAGAFTYKAMSITSGNDDTEKKLPNTVSQVIPPIQPRPIIRPEPVPAQQPTTVYVDRESEQRVEANPVRQQQTNNQGPTEAELIRERMFASSLGVNENSAPIASSGQNAGGSLGNGSGNELSDRLEPMQLSASRATMLPDRNYLMTEGTMLDCMLQTRMITTQPGMTRCILTRDVYSDNGRVVLLDRGSVLTGFYQAGITQGQARIFVQWARARTPLGVSIDLASPGTGPLGEAGVGGYVDNHFWARFGGAIMISMIGDLGSWASRQGSSQGDNSIQFSNTSQGVEQAAAEALRNSINIPPTLYKNQGERVSVFLARDLDFSHVYNLRTK